MLFNKELYFYRKNKSEMCAKCFFTSHSHVTLSQTPVFTLGSSKITEILILGQQPLKNSSTLFSNEISKMNYKC